MVPAGEGGLAPNEVYHLIGPHEAFFAIWLPASIEDLQPAFAKQSFIGVSEARHAAGMTFIPAAVKNFIA